MMTNPFQGMPQGYAVQPAQPQWAQQPQPMYRAPNNQLAAPSPRVASAVTQLAPPASFNARGATPDENPVRATMKLPSPEAFGLCAAPKASTAQAVNPLVGNQLSQERFKITAVNWTVVREELHRLGAKSFQVEQMNDGRHRFACKVSKLSGQTDLVEVFGQTEEEAVRNGLDKANAIRYGL